MHILPAPDGAPSVAPEAGALPLGTGGGPISVDCLRWLAPRDAAAREADDDAEIDGPTVEALRYEEVFASILTLLRNVLGGSLFRVDGGSVSTSILASSESGSFSFSLLNPKLVFGRGRAGRLNFSRAMERFEREEIAPGRCPLSEMRPPVLSGGLDKLLEEENRDVVVGARGLTGEAFAAELSVGRANDATDCARFRVGTLFPDAVDGTRRCDPVLDSTLLAASGARSFSLPFGGSAAFFLFSLSREEDRVCTRNAGGTDVPLEGGAFRLPLGVGDWGTIGAVVSGPVP